MKRVCVLVILLPAIITSTGTGLLVAVISFNEVVAAVVLRGDGR